MFEKSTPQGVAILMSVVFMPKQKSNRRAADEERAERLFSRGK
jgi:hypothetical protein